ncbi:MAG: DUF1002 domain-containing protein, partial [Paeniclostridium sordellii]|nr:DUF1002 domain-containing protein [Paeniclostridium sordellii]
NLMLKISKQDYNYKEMKDALESVSNTVNDHLKELGENVNNSGILDTVKGWFDGIGNWVSNLFGGDNKDLGILENTNDKLLGDNAKIDATDKNAINLPSNEEVEGFFTKVWNWFTGLFNNEPKKEESTDSRNSQSENTNNESNNNEINDNENATNSEQSSDLENKDNNANHNNDVNNINDANSQIDNNTQKSN